MAELSDNRSSCRQRPGRAGSMPVEYSEGMDGPPQTSEKILPVFPKHSRTRSVNGWMGEAFCRESMQLSVAATGVTSSRDVIRPSG